MKDNFGREINYLRLSLTQKCDLHCVYCGCEPPEAKELTVPEITKIVNVFAGLGITKVRLTGGEPLLRQDIAEITANIKAVKGIEKVVLTTNGTTLFEKAQMLKAAGLDAVNISLDSLDRETYKKLTGKDTLDKVLTGIDKALEVGLKPVRINSVLIRGQNDGEAGKLIELAKNRAVDVRFIELMPFSDAGENGKLIIKADEILKEHPYLRPCDDRKTASTAAYYTADGFTGRIGFITPVSRKFCDKCNRIRLLADGKLKPCLGHKEVFDLSEHINNEEMLRQTIIKAIESKPIGHNFECACGDLHAMNKIGG